MSTWRLKARVTRYNVNIEGVSFQHGDFARSTALWWVPLSGAHDARHLVYGTAVEYHDHEDALDIDFATDELFLIDAIQAGVPIEFSVNAMPYPDYGKDLYEVTTCIPPSRGKCAGTGILALDPAPEYDDLIAGWRATTPRPLGQPREATRPCSAGRELRDRYGRPRDDVDALADALASIGRV